MSSPTISPTRHARVLVGSSRPRHAAPTPLAAPMTHHASIAGAPSRSAASNDPTTSVAGIVATSVTFASTASLSPSSPHRRMLARNSTAKTPSKATAPTSPRSETKATQSLLGHGLAVMPLLAMDLSPAGA